MIMLSSFYCLQGLEMSPLAIVGQTPVIKSASPLVVQGPECEF